MKYTLLTAFAAMTLVACKSDSKKEDEKQKDEEPATVNVVNSEGLKIGFYTFDSITTQFDLYKTEMDAFEKQGKQLENQMKQLEEKYANKMKAYESGMRSQSLTPNQQANFEQQLQGIQQEVMTFQNTKMVDFQNRQMKATEVIQNKIKQYGQEFAKKHGLSLFLIQGTGSSVAYAEDMYDMTKPFIEYMNAKEKELNGEE